MKFLDMKVKEFIDRIRPITILNPETDLEICNFKVPCNLEIDKVIISSNLVTISVVPGTDQNGK